MKRFLFAVCALVSLTVDAAQTKLPDWQNPELEGVAADVMSLNAMLKDYASVKGYAYVDFHTALKDENSGLPQHHAADGIHPNLDCYRIMEGMLLEVLR